LSKRIGVSPWYWWDDVPASHHDALYVLPCRYTQGTPAVKYRGSFINDVAPQTSTWESGVFGKGMASCCPQGFNHLYYEKVFETLLRLKANYL